MMALERSTRLTIFMLIVLITFGSSAMAFEVVEPGETQQFSAGDDCLFTPYTDTVFKGTTAKCVEPSRVESAALLSISAVNLDVESFATLLTGFSVTPGGETVLDATVSAVVDWDGVLFGAGVLGAGASVKIDMILVDETTGTVKGQTEVLSKSQDSTGLKGIDVGGTRVSGAKTISFTGSVVRGHDHSIRLKLTCQAEAGLIGLDVGCIFYNDVFLGVNLGGDPHAKWTELSITVEQDIFERLDQIDMKLGEMDAKLDALQSGQNEIQRLLLTPQGRRSSDAGDFPLHPETESPEEPGVEAFCAAIDRISQCAKADWLDDEEGSPRDCQWRRGACQAR